MKWEKRDIPPELVKSISAKYGCDLLTASILIRRGLVSGSDVRFFLEDDPRHLINPFELPGMEDAVERVLAAKEEGEKVLVFGDRDVDGITAAALVTGFLQSIGIDVTARLPEGDEPYGLSIQAVEEFAAAYGTLIITVDCGISNGEEVRRAAELGVDVIITDHHNPQEEIPPALTIVNPKLAESTYPFKDLAGCAVAYKLVSALRFALKSELYGQEVCLINTRPLNDAWVIEAAKLRNLRNIGTLTETVVPGAVGIAQTRLPAFLEGQQILAWDAALQKRTLAKVFGSGVEINMLDISGEVGKLIPSVAGKSLVRIKELSRSAKYQDNEMDELEVFVSLFSSFVKQREKHFSEDDAYDLQLVCLGTIADIMPLLHENRIIVKQGLQALVQKPRPGLSDLLFKLQLSGRNFGATDISWILCPVINAAGRMGKPGKALELILEKDPQKREALATQLIAMNEDRKKIGEETWTLAEPLAADNLDTYQNKLAVAYGDTIPRGVTGIMANRLSNRFKVPSLVASVGENVIVASLRSARGYDLRFLLEPLSDLFIDWGGHDFAAGCSLSRENWQPFLQRLQSVAADIQLQTDEGGETLNVDAELPLSYLTPDIFALINRFEPYGEGNETLTFVAKDMRIADINLMGKPEAKHVKLTMDTGKHKWPAVYWQAAEKVRRDFDLGDQVDLAFKITRNYFKGNETPQLVVSDLKRSKT
ncbi:MAG: single-stranded-DNA-specific exonuclease RecJ [Treponema sp.]|jgi:single-stranded-DNA-specific exonuclease|nr:single-stranded-DNA-specific exonuclease RecJ [Treponema sp.]